MKNTCSHIWLLWSVATIFAAATYGCSGFEWVKYDQLREMQINEVNVVLCGITTDEKNGTIGTRRPFLAAIPPETIKSHA